MDNATLDDAVAETKASTKPLATFRYRGVSASVFENSGKNGTFHKVVVERTFKTGDGFKSNSSFGRDDLPILRHVIDQAYAWMLEQEINRVDEE